MSSPTWHARVSLIWRATQHEEVRTTTCRNHDTRMSYSFVTVTRSRRLLINKGKREICRFYLITDFVASNWNQSLLYPALMVDFSKRETLFLTKIVNTNFLSLIRKIMSSLHRLFHSFELPYLFLYQNLLTLVQQLLLWKRNKQKKLLWYLY